MYRCALVATTKLDTARLRRRTAPIVTGIIFGLRELGELQKSRQLDATLKLVDLIQNEAAAVAIGRLVELTTGRYGTTAAG